MTTTNFQPDNFTTTPVPTEKRFRTVNTAYEEILSKDPGTAVTRHAIRTILKENKIPSLDLGHKVIFDLNDLERYLGMIC